MNKGKRIGRMMLCLVVSLMMVMTLIPNLPSGMAFAADGDYPIPDTSKELIDNEDGTYTLKLSVTGSAKTETENPKVNVVFVMDRSGSMSNDDSYTGQSGYAVAQYGRYGKVNGQYVQLYYRNTYGTGYTAVGNNDNHATVYYRTGTPGNYTYTQYSLGRYNQVNNIRRDQVAIAAATDLADNLLSYNTASSPDTVEMAFVWFNDMASPGNNSQWTTSTTTAENVIRGFSGQNNTGTNWEDALIDAKTLADNKADDADQEGEQMFIIFLTDGNPTRYVDDNGNRQGNGQETTTNIATCYNEAAPRARQLTDAGYEMYNIGVFGNVSRMEDLTAYSNDSTAANHGTATYYPASNAAALEAAFAEILRSITNSLSLSDVKFTDGVTDMTHSTGVNGVPDNFQYTMTVNGEETPWADAPEATVNENKEVIWDLSKDREGNDLIIADGVTVTCSFLVWPDQDAMDLIADLNNKKVSYDSLTDDQKAQITGGPAGPFALKTNTECKLNYSILENRDGDIHEIPQDPITLDPPEPMPLYIDWLSLEKKWDDSLDPDQREEVEGEVVLDFYKDNTIYTLPGYENGITLTEAENWIKEDFLSIATGIMVSEDSPAYDADAYPVVTYDGKDYCILETGHDYHFQEQDINDHYELTAYTYHPMLVDGVLHNLTFEYDDEDNIIGVTEGAEISTVSATNTIKGGVSITKKVVDEDGNEVDTADPFTITMHMQTPEGDAYKYDYRIYYGEKNPHYNDPEPGTENPSEEAMATNLQRHRSGHFIGTATEVTVTLYQGDELRFVNMDDDTRYYVEETVPQGYELDGMTYQIRYGDDDPETEEDESQYHDFTDDQKVTIDGKTYYIMDGNSSAAVEVTNILKKGDLKVAKTVVNGDTNKEFTFTLDLEDSSEEEVEGTFNYVIYNSDDEKVSDGTISSGGTFKLKDGQYIIVEGLPAGTTYTVTETEEDGYTTTVDGTETLEATGTVIVDNPTTDPVEMASSEFTNTYDASGTAVLEAIKAISGADWPEDATITFTLAGQGGTLPTTKTVTLTEPGKATFDAITYGLSDAGQTYNYTITEDGFGDGWTADPGKVITATVVVTDNGDGTLDTAITYSPEDDTITNKYEAEGEVELEAIKAISGADWPEDATITFTLAGTGGTLPETKTVTLTEPGKATFDAITYDESDAGQTYTYTITEDGFGTGWTADPGKVITATVKVTDNGDGTLDTEVTYDPEDDTITNVYSAEGTAVLQATKVVDGAEWPENGSITFTLAGEGGTLPETKAITLTAAGTATFDAITYDESDIGQTYTYTITEDGFGTGWTADPGKVITATVKVTDKGDGELATEITYDPEDATITNIYDAEGEVELEAIKAIEGADWPEDATITFTLAGEGGTLPTTKTVTLEEPGKATFDAITYDESDIGKTYTYTITEDGFGTGWTADPGKVITATVKVIDNGDGTLDTEVTYDPEDDTITNKYDAEGEVELKAIKAIEGAGWPANGSITFTLAGEGGTLPETKTVTLTAPGTAEFDAITYDESDIGETYTYTITEDGFGDGWTADPGKVITATVKVIDNGDGTLDTEVTYDPEDDTITNVYAAEGTAELKAIKAIEGAGWPENGSITFTLAGEGGTLPTTKTVTLTEPGTATFGAITYDESDIGETYTYTITEDGFGTGWTANPGKVITATVKVTDKGDGTLATEITYSPENDTITNKYDAEGEVELEAIKAISGADWPEGKSITFTLAGEGGTLPETKTETLTAPGKATFDAITYDESDIGQTYTYTITEDGFGDGWTADPGKVITATVKVTDNGDGTLDTEVTYDPEDDTITNIYEASGSATLKAKKLLEGRDWMESESFTFTLKDPNGTVVEEKTVTEDGEVEFAAISYDESDAGKSYTYTITETGNSSANVTPSGPVEATVTITDNGDGSLATDVTYSPEDATIINTYVPTPVNAQINVNKTIDGFLEGQPDNTFEFTLYDEDGEQVGEKISITTKSGKGSASFAPIEYPAVGEYNYTVKETIGSAAGYTYSTIEYPVVVTVTDDPENGKLVAEVSYGDYTVTSGEETLLDVINEFDMEDVEVTLSLTKKIDDQSDSAPEGTFNFTLYKDEVGDDNLVEETSITTNGLTGSAEFKPLTFDKSGEYTYVVVEEEGDVNGFTYDTTVHTYKIIIDDNFDAAILEVDEEGSTLDVTITNVYKATATSTVLKVKKEIEDTSGSAYETEFTFTLTGAEGSPMPEEEGGDTVTVTGAQEGAFGEIKYEKAGSFDYTIKEVAGDAAGYQYDTTAYKATVTVVDDGGDLVATAAYIDKAGESQTALTITNTYDPKDAEIVITANKRVEDKTGGAAGNPKTFTFELLDEDGNVIETVTRQGGGTVTFSKLTYSHVGEYNYIIREVAGSDSGYTYDTNEYGVIVEVTDPDKDGILKAAITAGDSVEFVNPYEAKPCGTELELTKKLTGRDLEDGEFEFVLVDITGGGSEEIETVSNNEKGNITFGYIEYYKAGTHTYEVYEVVPEETNGVVYDQSIEVVTVKVTDDGNGQLSLTVTYGGDKTFENSYEPEGSFEPEVTKRLEGKDLKDGQFTFTMVGPDGQTYTAKNDAEGKVVFEALDFDINDVGQTYEYTITEVNDGQENIKYDDHAEKLTITIKDNGDGTLQISGDYSGKATFTNKYEEPPAPPTGDTTVVVPYIVIGISALILLMMLLFRTRKNRA